MSNTIGPSKRKMREDVARALGWDDVTPAAWSIAIAEVVKLRLENVAMEKALNAFPSPFRFCPYCGVEMPGGNGDTP